MVRLRLLVLRWAIELRNKVEALWSSHAFGMWLVFVGMAVSSVLLYWPPAPGIGVAVMGISAALMTARKEPTAWEKAGWTFMMFALLLVEVLAIRKDRREHDEQVRTLLQQGSDIKIQAQTKFTEIGGNLKSGIEGILDQSHKQFEDTVQRESRHFDATLAKQQELAESLTETLTPGSDATPSNTCAAAGIVIGPDDLIIFLGTTAHVTNYFPHVILKVGDQNVVSIDRNSKKELVLTTDIRGPDAKLVARFNKEGVVVNKNNVLAVKHGQHAIVIADQYGRQVLIAEYLNPQAFRIDALTYIAHEAQGNVGVQLKGVQLATVTDNAQVKVGCISTKGSPSIDVSMPF